jgi:glutamine amidotransferase
MFGLVAADPVNVAELLRDAPRSLHRLSIEHCDGWGVAFATPAWRVHRSTACAARCSEFDTVVDSLRARIAIAHVRKKTVGETSLLNTHPFQRGRFVFAHNGTVKAGALAARTSSARLAEVAGTTDSERLFAFILTHIDDTDDLDRGVTAAVHALRGIPELGAATFLLSCGARIYAYRHGRTLFTLSRPGATYIASEALTEDPWRELPEGGLAVIDEQRLALAA